MTNAAQVIAAQQRADTIAQTLDSLKDSSKTLSSEVITSLVAYAQGTDDYGHLSLDDRQHRLLAQREATNSKAVREMTQQIADLANQLEALGLQLLDIRKFLKLGTAEQLAQEVAAGKTTTAMNAAEVERIKQAALERTKAFQNGRQQAADTSVEQTKKKVIHVDVNRK